MNQPYEDAMAEAESFCAARAPTPGYMASYFSDHKFSDAEMAAMKANANTNGDTLAEDLCDKLLAVSPARRRNVWARTRKHFDG